MLSDAEEARVARLMMSDWDLGQDEDEDEEAEKEVQDALDMLDSSLDYDYFEGERDGEGHNHTSNRDAVDEKDIEFAPPSQPQPASTTSTNNASAGSAGLETSLPDVTDLARSPSREINFSPGGSGMQTAEAPLQGSFSQTMVTRDVVGGKGDDDDEQTGTLKSASTHSNVEVNFSPTAGRQMETSGAPRHGSFRVKPTSSGRHPPKVPVDEAYVHEVTMQDVDQEKWKSDKDAIRSSKESFKPTPKTSNKHLQMNYNKKLDLQSRVGNRTAVEMDLEEDDEDDDDKATSLHGACDSHGGSRYVGDVIETQRRKKEDINFRPDGFLSVTALDAPKQGSFHDRSSSPHRGTSTASPARGVTSTFNTMAGVVTSVSSSREINFSPGVSDIHPSGVPKAGGFVTDRDNVSPNPNSPTTAESIPGESFAKMGAMMQQNEDISEHTPEKDEHDDLLDAVLGDSDSAVGNGTTDEYVPDADMQELERALDDGLNQLMETTEQSGPNVFVDEDNNEALENVGNDLVTRELEALLGDGNVDEEIEFDFTSAPSTGNIPDNISETVKSSRRKNIGVGRIFRTRKPESNQQAQTGPLEEKPKQKSSIVTRPFKGIAVRTSLRPTVSKGNNNASNTSERAWVEAKPSKKRSYFGAKSVARSFMAATKSSSRKFGKKTGDVTANKDDNCRRNTKGDAAIGRFTKTGGSFMAPTFTFMKAVEANEKIETQRRQKREEEARKTVVDLKTRGTESRPQPLLSFDNDEIHSPPIVQKLSRGGSPQQTPNLRISTSPQKSLPQRMKTAFSPMSVGSLSSQCTVTSFRNPIKEGIRGCQNNFDPYLHERKGPCELCVFRLDDEEKDQLDIKGRHFKVMFTTGGCKHCKEYPRSFDEAPVRLCVKCWSTAHRPVKARILGKGNLPGYSFAKNDYVY